MLHFWKSKVGKNVSEGYSSINANNSQELKPLEDIPISEDLVTLLTKVPDLSVVRYGHNAPFKVRGQASFHASIDPLTVINGNSVGSKFAHIYDTVDPRDVSTISY